MDNEPSNMTGNAVRKLLEALGAEKIGTGAFELEEPDLGAVLAAVQDVLEKMKRPAGGGRLDHFWLYIDHTDEST